MKPVFIYAQDTLEIKYVRHILKETPFPLEKCSGPDDILQSTATNEVTHLIPLDSQSYAYARSLKARLRKTILVNMQDRTPFRILQEFLKEEDITVTPDPLEQLKLRTLLSLYTKTDNPVIMQQYKSISKEDRQLRGISAEDEEAAELSLKKYVFVEECGVAQLKERCLLVHAQTPHFIAIIDRCIFTYDHILIYDDRSMVYVGTAAPHLGDFKARLQEAFPVYSGGNDQSGYLGIKRDEVNNPGEIRRWTISLWEQIKSGYKKDVTLTFLPEEKLYSSHIFTFPFRAKYGTTNGNEEERWKIQEPQWSAIRTYNTTQYYLPFVHEFLTLSEKADVLFERKKLELKAEEKEYIIDTGNQGLIYTLEITTVELHVLKFATESSYQGTDSDILGVLSFHCENRTASQSRPVDILNINQHGRRIFPPFLLEGGNFKDASQKTRGIETARQLRVMGWECNFEVNAENFNAENKYPLPSFITAILAWDHYHQVMPVIDDRMHVMCWYGNDALSEQISNDKKSSNYYARHDWWYSFVFVDKPENRTVQDPAFWKRIAKDSTYTRWTGYHTWYGVSRYSNVLLTSTLSTLEKIGAQYLHSNFSNLYFEMTKLALFQYAGIIHFMNELREIDAYGENRKEKTAKLKRTRQDFEYFKNHVHQTLSSPQDQAIELYEFHQRQFRIVSLLADLESDILRLHEYARVESQQLEEESQRREEQNLSVLTHLASIIALFAIIPAFISGFFGMNIFDADLKPMKGYGWFAAVFVGVMIGMGIFIWRLFSNIEAARKVNEGATTPDERKSASVSYRIFKYLLGFCIIIFIITVSYPIIRHLTCGPDEDKSMKPTISVPAISPRDTMIPDSTLNESLDSLNPKVKE